MTQSHISLSFRIVPKTDGTGFVATSEHPPVTFEGATREEVENKVRQKIIEMVGPALAASLPVSFSDQLPQSGEKNVSFTVKKTFKIGGGVSNVGAGAAKFSGTFTSGGGATGTQLSAFTTDSSAGPVISSSSASSEEDFGPVRRTGDGSAAMLLLRILIVIGVVMVIAMLLTRR